MKFVSVRDFRSRSAQVWKQLKQVDEMVITSNGKPVALLTALSDENLESMLNNIRKAKAMAAASALQLQSIQSGRNKMTMSDINREIAEVRKERKQ